MEEKQIMFSMNDDRIKHLSEALSNPSCRRILNLLSEKELTETDLSKELKIPLNTVDYNVKKLISTGLIEKIDHFWSIRGKKMPVYRVSNRRIIISPKESKSLAVLFISIIGTGILAWKIKNMVGSRLLDNSSYFTFQDSIQNSGIIEKSLETPISPLVSILGWQWFLIGAWFGILFFFILTLINERRYKNE
jgi:DNA-binding transcriptional ArsR family regulator